MQRARCAPTANRRRGRLRSYQLPVGEEAIRLVAGHHHGDGRLALWVKAPKGEQDALVGADANRYFVPPYLGPSGWVGVQLDDASDPDWDEVATLLEQAWRMNAGKRLLATYDAEHG